MLALTSCGAREQATRAETEKLAASLPALQTPLYSGERFSFLPKGGFIEPHAAVGTLRLVRLAPGNEAAARRLAQQLIGQGWRRERYEIGPAVRGSREADVTLVTMRYHSAEGDWLLDLVMITKAASENLPSGLDESLPALERHFSHSSEPVIGYAAELVSQRN